MRVKYKRVCLTNLSTGERMDFTEEYIYTLSDKAILDSLYEVNKNVWIGNQLYKICPVDNHSVTYMLYEVYKVIERR